MRARSTLGLCLFLGCGGADRVELSGFAVDRGSAHDALSIQGPHGPLSATVSGHSFAVRAAAATIEEKFGAYKLIDQPLGDWVEGASIGAFSGEGSGFVADVLSSAGAKIGSVHLSVDHGNLRLRFTAFAADQDRARVALRCDPENLGGYLGFGAQTHDVDQRGQRVPIWVSEQGIGQTDDDEIPPLWPLVGSRHQSYAPIPLFVAPRAGASYGVFSTTEHYSIWDVCKTDPGVLSVEAWEGQLELVFSPGPSPLEVIQQQTELTGRAPLGPDWTFGVWMERIGGTEAVRSEAALLRQEHIPASAIWSEDWRGGSAVNGSNHQLDEDWRLDTALYPGFPGLIEGLHQRGLKMMTYFNTFVVDGVDVAAEAREGGFLVRDRTGAPISFDGPSFTPASLIDLYQLEARTFVKGELRRALDMGIDGWMADFGEWYPADPAAVTPPNGRDAAAAHQRYPIAWAEVNREAIAESGRDDVVVFHRSAYTGSQGRVGVLWAGDQRTSFQADDGLPTVIPIMLGLGAAGFPIVTHDIGGYASATNPPTTKDLFLRWTTLGALGPVMRTHHGRDALHNWRWSSDAETTAHFRRWSELHTRWFPLWKGLAKEAALTGAPILRPMAFQDPSDPSLAGIRDQYMIGDALLIAPVVTASTSTRAVIFPKGRWFSWAGGEVVEGPSRAIAPIPLGEAGIWARAGAIVPELVEGVESLVPTAEVLDLDEVRSEREIEVWLGASGSRLDGEGGTITLESPGPAMGPVHARGSGVVELGSNTRTSSATMPVGGTLELLDAGGAIHRLRIEGIAATRPIVVRAHY